ncbi:MAG: hypothetical protein SNH73_05555 [Rikenellaceae bacterium]
MTSNTFRVILFLILFSTASSLAQNRVTVADQLKSARESNKSALIIVSDNENSAEHIVELAKGAATEYVDIIEVNADDQDNFPIINEYRLDGVPLPCILVISDRGDTLGGLLSSQITAESISDVIPTPKYCEIAHMLRAGRSIIINISDSQFKSDKAAKELCEATAIELGEHGGAMSFDIHDEVEAKLINMLILDAELSDSYIAVINTQGMIVGRFHTLPTQQELIASTKEVVEATCSCGVEH